MRQILVSTCGECPYSHHIGTNMETHKRSVSCPKIYGTSYADYYDYNRNLYNNSVWEDELNPKCPLSEVLDV